MQRVGTDGDSLPLLFQFFSLFGLFMIQDLERRILSTIKELMNLIQYIRI